MNKKKKIIMLNEMSAGLASVFNEDHKLYLQLSWELSDYLELSRAFKTDKTMGAMYASIIAVLKDLENSTHLNKKEKVYLNNVLKKINSNLESIDDNIFTSMEVLAFYFLYGFAPSFIKPFWFEPQNFCKPVKNFNFTVLNIWLRAVQGLEVGLNLKDEPGAQNLWKRVFFKIIIKFQSEGLIEIKDEKSKLKTQKFYIFVANVQRMFTPLDFGFYLYPPQCVKWQNKLYLQGLTILNAALINRPNDRSLKSFNLKNLAILEKLFSKPLYFNQSIFNEIKKLILTEKLTNFENSPEILEDVYFKNAFRNESGLEINEMYRYLIFLKLGDYIKYLKDGFYFSYYFDFRGRLYYSGLASPQATRIFRFCYYYGDLNLKKLGQTSSLLDIAPHIKKIKSRTNLIERYPVFAASDWDYPLFWIFIEYGKLKKSSALSFKKWWLNWEELIFLGIEMFQQKREDLTDFEDKLEHTYLTNILKNINDGKNFNQILYKDSTASGIQLLTLALQPIDLNVSQACNLKSTTQWYDTYSFIIYKFLEKKEIHTASKNFFNRKHLKKIIMTYNYSATYFSCLKYFKEEVYKTLKKNQELILNNDDFKNLYGDFKNFYDFLNAFFESGEFFKSSINDVKKMLINYLEEYKEIKIMVSDGAEIYLEYFKEKEYRINDFSTKKRKTISFIKPSDELDMTQTSRAIKANLTHALEANLLRLVLMDLDERIITIHDCYGVGLFEVDEVIASLNKNINLVCYANNFLKWNKDETYNSVFIIL